METTVKFLLRLINVVMNDTECYSHTQTHTRKDLKENSMGTGVWADCNFKRWSRKVSLRWLGP